MENNSNRRGREKREDRRHDRRDGERKPFRGDRHEAEEGRFHSHHQPHREEEGESRNHGHRDSERKRFRGDRRSDDEKDFRPRNFHRNNGGEGSNVHRSRQKRERTPEEGIRLNRFIANAGICSRREADDYITSGVVKVNGKVVTELGTKVMPGDTVYFHDTPLRSEHKVYILLNKPKNTVTTASDPHGRMTVMDLVAGACKERVYPVGRLDRNTTGVLLLTNDGDLAAKLTHPRYEKKKVYHVHLTMSLRDEDRKKLLEGIELEDGPIKADELEVLEGTHGREAGIEIHSGRNRIVRRMFEALGYEVEKLDRVYFAGLTKYNLPRGRWRFLTELEIANLKSGAYE